MLLRRHVETKTMFQRSGRDSIAPFQLLQTPRSRRRARFRLRAPCEEGATVLVIRGRTSRNMRRRQSKFNLSTGDERLMHAIISGWGTTSHGGQTHPWAGTVIDSCSIPRERWVGKSFAPIFLAVFITSIMSAGCK